MRNLTYLKCNSNNSKIRLYEQMDAYLEYCAVARQMSQKTIRSKMDAYKFFLAETSCRSLEELTNEELDIFIKKELDRGAGVRTINLRITQILSIVKYWREMGVMIPLRTPLVMKLKETPRRRVFYTREEIQEVLDHCVSDRQWLLVKIPFDTGMRISELRQLSLDQMTGRRVNFVGKGEKAREVYLCRDTYERLMAYVEENGIRDRVWINEWRQPLSESTIRKIMREAFERCGHTDFHPHALRHSFASDLQRQGADVMAIREMMGHANVATTQRYLHGFEGRLESLFDKYKG